jgi:hypothetical protein
MNEYRQSKMQRAWFASIENDPSKEIINTDTTGLGCSHQTEEIKVSVLDYKLSQVLGRPTIVQVTLDLLANEKEVYVRTTALGNKPAECICTFHTQYGGEKVNIWGKGSVAMSYDLGKPAWLAESLVEYTNTDEFIQRHALALDLFKSATNKGFAGYRGYRLNKSAISASQKV